MTSSTPSVSQQGTSTSSPQTNGLEIRGNLKQEIEQEGQTTPRLLFGPDSFSREVTLQITSSTSQLSHNYIQNLPACLKNAQFFHSTNYFNQIGIIKAFCNSHQISFVSPTHAAIGATVGVVAGAGITYCIFKYPQVVSSNINTIETATKNKQLISGVMGLIGGTATGCMTAIRDIWVNKPEIEKSPRFTIWRNLQLLANSAVFLKEFVKTDTILASYLCSFSGELMLLPVRIGNVNIIDPKRFDYTSLVEPKEAWVKNLKGLNLEELKEGSFYWLSTEIHTEKLEIDYEAFITIYNQLEKFLNMENQIENIIQKIEDTTNHGPKIDTSAIKIELEFLRDNYKKIYGEIADILILNAFQLFRTKKITSEERRQRDDELNKIFVKP